MASATDQRRFTGKIPGDLRFSFSTRDAGKRLLDWYRKNKRDLPWRARFSKSGDPYHIWVSEIMLQQTVIKAVIPVYERFLQHFPTIEALARSTTDDVREQVRGLGYYRRFHFLHQAAKLVTTNAAGMPQTVAGWRDLPGVGDYTAAAVCSIAFNIPAAVVDGNVERVFCRLMDLRVPPNLPELKRRFKTLAAEFLDSSSPGDFNQALMELGQTLCTPSAPKCTRCPLANGCLSKKNRSQDLAPAAKFKRDTVQVTLHLIVHKQGSKIGLMERSADSKFLKGTWGFVTSTEETPRFNGSYTHCGTVTHAITHHRITAHIWSAGSALPQQPMKWVLHQAVEKNLISNLDRKAWSKFLYWQTKND